MTLEERWERLAERQERDAQRWREVAEDICMLCAAQGQDKRNLFIDCFYDVAEVVPEAIEFSALCQGLPEMHRRGYYLRLCRACRGRLLDKLGEWRRECIALLGVPKDSDGDVLERPEGADVPVRVNGRIVWMDETEWREWRAQAEEGEDTHER